MEEEIFYPLKDFEEYYEISEKGTVRSLDREVNSSFGARRIIKGRTLKPDLSNKGYWRIPLSITGKVRKKFGLHRLLAINFIPNPHNHNIVNHIDGNPLNNSLGNLEWCTQSHNIKHKFDIGYINHRRILDEEAVIDIFTNTIMGENRKDSTVGVMCEKYNTTKTVIRDIVRGRTYRNITDRIKNPPK